MTWPAGRGLGRLMASAWLEDRSTKPARSTRVPERARRPAETAWDARTRPAVRVPVPTRILPGRAPSTPSALPAPVRPAAADRMARAGPSRRVPPPAGARVIRPALPAARGPRNRARGARAAGATAAGRAGPVAPAVAVGPAATGAGEAPAVPADPMTRGARVSPGRADPMTRGARVSPGRADPMTRGARVFPARPSAVAVARTTPAAVGVAAGARSAA